MNPDDADFWVNETGPDPRDGEPEDEPHYDDELPPCTRPNCRGCGCGMPLAKPDAP